MDDPTNRIGFPFNTPPQPPEPDWRRWLWPLRSRKVQVAVATVITAWAANAGVALNEETIVAVLGVGVALILGIAIEDAARG